MILRESRAFGSLKDWSRGREFRQGGEPRRGGKFHWGGELPWRGQFRRGRTPKKTLERAPKRALKRAPNRTPNRTPNGTLETTLTWSEAIRRLVAFHVVVIVGLLGVLGGGGGKAFAFVVPQSPEVGAGSQWVYESNLGTAHVRMLERVAIGPELERYRWEMRIGVLHYVEELRLAWESSLTATEREVGGFGLIKQRFFYDEPELVLTATLEVGTRWEWNGHVRQGGEVREATAKGEVLAYHPIVVPAGEFDVYHIRIEREDGFGTRQSIDLWFDPNVGPIKAVGDLEWSGLIGFFQRLVGLKRLDVELVEYSIVAPVSAGDQAAPEGSGMAGRSGAYHAGDEHS